MSANDELQAHTCEKMLEFYGDVVQGKVQDLTEQWKKGELSEGYYYFKMPDGTTDVASEYRLMKYILTRDADKISLLAPVPSYEELEELKIDNHNLNAWIKHFQPKYKKMEKENQQLKELLISAKDIIEWYSTENGYIDLPTKDLLTKIDNAIGEKK